jgi:hypothetical protein
LSGDLVKLLKLTLLQIAEPRKIVIVGVCVHDLIYSWISAERQEHAPP